MSKITPHKLRNGWAGQAMAEYLPTLTTIGTFAIVILVSCGPEVASMFDSVNKCFEGAAVDRVVAEECEQDGVLVADNTDSSDDPSNSAEPNDPGDSNSSGTSSGSNSSGTSSGSNSSGTSNGSNSSGTSSGSNSSGTSSGSNSSGTSSGSGDSGDSGGREEPDGPIDVEKEDDEDDGSGVSAGQQCPPDVNFDGLPAGTILTDQFPGMTITTHDPVNHPAMIFDSANPTGGDDDLGTPHEDFGGPGEGNGGAAGEPGENSVELGNVIIISEDGDTNDPDDNASGGDIIFELDNATTVSYMYFLDQDSGKEATVTLYDQADSAINSGVVPIPAEGGDNGVFRIDLNTTGVYKIVVSMPGSGAIASVLFCEDTVPNDPDSSETEEPADDTNTAYEPECGDYKSVIVEPREDNAQHVMVQYPVPCDANGNVLENEPGAGLSTLRLANSNSTYFSATLSGHLNGTFDAWCVDYDNPISLGQDYTGDNYDNTSVSVDRPQNLPIVQWLINFDWQAQGYTIEDVQGAIWLVIDSTPIEETDLGTNSESLAQLAFQTAGDDNTDTTINIAEAPEEASEVFVVEMTPSSENNYRNNGSVNGWRMNVAVTVTDNLGQPVEGVQVRLDFTDNGGDNRNCTTDENGQCTVQSRRINSNRQDAGATLDTIRNTGDLTYDSSQNTVTTARTNRP